MQEEEIESLAIKNLAETAAAVIIENPTESNRHSVSLLIQTSVEQPSSASSSSSSSPPIDSDEAATLTRPLTRTSAVIETQLYDQLSQLKPIVSKPQFKSSTSICLNPQETSTTQTSSMVITPDVTAAPAVVQTTKPTSRNNSIQISLGGSTKIQQPKLGVRFSDMPNVYAKSSSSSKILTNGSMPPKLSLPKSESDTSSDLGSNSSSSTSISNDSRPNDSMDSGSSGGKNNSITRNRASALYGGGVVASLNKRNSSVITPSNTSTITNHSSTANTTTTNSFNNPRRVSLSVTDL